MAKRTATLFLLLLTLATCAAGLTADDIYARATQKYLTGDMDGAQADLAQVLRLNPGHDKARELLNEVRRELGKTAPPAALTPAPAPAPTPAVRPETIKPVRVVKKTTVQPRSEKILLPPTPEAKPAPATVRIIPQLIYVKTDASSGLFSFGWLDFAWLFALLGTLLYLVARLILFYLKQEIERRSVQICTECKYANPSGAEFCSKCGNRLKPWIGITAAQRKWYAQFGWKKNPFTLDITPKLFTGYQAQVETIIDKVYAKTGHILIMGNKGVGKTTLLKWLTETLAKDFHAVYIPRPTDNFTDLLDYLAKQLKLKVNKGERVTIYDLEALADKSKMNILLLLDEAHEFNEEFERPLRSLGDLNGVTFILAGLTETGDKIKKMSPPFYDRIIQQVSLHHLSLAETTDLIRKRIEDAGGTGLGPFTPEASENVFKMTGGVPRMILKVCDWIITDAIHHNVDTIRVAQEAGLPQDAMSLFNEETKS